MSYVHLFKPYAYQPGQEEKYQVTVLVPKTDADTMARINNAIEAAKQRGISEKWNGQCPPIIPTPVYDGDGVRPSDGMAFGPECKGHWVFTASAKADYPPEIVDNLVVFTQMLMQKYNVPLENVVRHYDVTGKWCPRPWMGDDTNTYYGTSGNEQWKKFKERLSGEELDMNIEEARKQLTSCADTGDTPSAWARDAAEFCKRKGIFNGDGAGNYGWQQPITREAVAQILYNAFESAGMLDAIPDKK